ncbi:MAG: non-canonical purine NTP pyrophosphatase [Verrucomicrobia bacterium]|nr:non-canonical purine NTP pyrophosphatase [Verrucomicrobiota bacterium]
MTTLVIATRNAHKVAEIRAILGEGFRCLALNDFPNAPAAVEDAATFEGNAAKKARSLAEWLAGGKDSRFTIQDAERAFVLADDSGLEVDALGGAPGVHSARFAAMENPASAGNFADADNNAKLLRLLADVPVEKRTARFRCALALVEIEKPSAASHSLSAIGGTQFFSGACEGRMDFAPRGAGGFGYDPLFVPDGFTQSFAELGEDTKNKLSHRAKALAKLCEWFAAQRGG